MTLGRPLTHLCIISHELYAVINHMCEQWILGPFLRFFEWVWVRGYFVCLLGTLIYIVMTFTHIGDGKPINGKVHITLISF